ncbi:rho GTPase-activating protein 17b isoform X3 [Paramormyrops kingsleyae]|uniref:rho GTPase-activating protein 17b isoform X3 n=1 Tax=Paramormyrops kingsleyae TaxID=1676925 RepID=UPI000CD5FD6F|nr:rho GTPase-activating protein 17-like isoform X3 [Paramormyrops kingsleyae]
MKKQFNRMKQLANQTVGRAEKTEVLSDDLLQIERRMDIVRLVSHNTHKRMVTCLQGHIGTDAEKRQKKLPQTALSQAMLDGAGQLGDESLIGKTMELCGDVENRLASELMQHEVQIEREVMDPLNQLAEVEIPNILKQRKQLAKLVLDYDSARARWLQQNKSMVSTTNSSGLTAKVEAIKEEVDEAMNKVEICKDQLAADMYTFSYKEGDYARYYVTLLEAQADFHRRALSLLDQVLPNIRAQQDSWTEKPAFGTSLSEHLKRSGREIALPIEACVMMLLETGMKEEGLFRIAAGASKLKKLKAALDCSTSQLEEFYSDPHAVAGALKSYLRELPEPLMTFELYEEWIQASNMSDPDKRLQALWVTCDSLPKHNKANFRYLVKFLARLAQESEVNKMTPSNIAIVLGPNLLWAKTEGSLAEMAAATSVHVMTIIEPIIQHADWFFPDEVDFNVSGMFVMPSSTTVSTSFLTPTDMDFGTTDKKRPISMAVLDSDSPRRDSSTSPVQKNGFSGGLPPNPYGAGGSSGPLSVPQPGARAPSPLMVRKGVKKPAPAPPKPTNPPPGQASSQPIASSSAAQPSAPLAKPIPSSSPSGQSLTPPSSMARRHSTNQLPIQAPSHPPPQPPMQVTPPLQPKAATTTPGTGESSADPSPPSTPTPPDTPPPDTWLPDISCAPPASPSYQSGSLPRPRPVPKPRHRPSVPPPPQPATHGSDGTNGVCRSTSKISSETLPEESPDGTQVLKGLSRTLEFTVEPPAVGPELESESTAL